MSRKIISTVPLLIFVNYTNFSNEISKKKYHPVTDLLRYISFAVCYRVVFKIYNIELVISYYALISIPSLPSSLRILAMIPSTSDVSSVLSFARNVMV